MVEFSYKSIPGKYHKHNGMIEWDGLTFHRCWAHPNLELYLLKEFGCPEEDLHADFVAEYNCKKDLRIRDRKL